MTQRKIYFLFIIYFIYFQYRQKWRSVIYFLFIIYFCKIHYFFIYFLRFNQQLRNPATIASLQMQQQLPAQWRQGLRRSNTRAHTSTARGEFARVADASVHSDVAIQTTPRPRLRTASACDVTIRERSPWRPGRAGLRGGKRNIQSDASFAMQQSIFYQKNIQEKVIQKLNHVRRICKLFSGDIRIATRILSYVDIIATHSKILPFQNHYLCSFISNGQVTFRAKKTVISHVHCSDHCPDFFQHNLVVRLHRMRKTSFANELLRHRRSCKRSSYPMLSSEHIAEETRNLCVLTARKFRTKVWFNLYDLLSMLVVDLLVTTMVVKYYFSIF